MAGPAAPVPLDTYFAMARGSQGGEPDDACAHGHDHSHGVPALEMTKWFDTNYHYMVPEFAVGQRFDARLDQAGRRISRGEGARLSDPPGSTRPGHLPQARQEQRIRTLDPLSLLGNLLPVYVEVLRRLAASGAEWVQIDEPCLVLDLDEGDARSPSREAYGFFAHALPKLKIMLAELFRQARRQSRYRAGAARRRAAS